MTLTYWQGYLAMFYFLDELYSKYKWDDLGVLLGAIDPVLFDGGLPMDQSEVIDWLDIVKKEDILKEELTEEENFIFMQNFILYKQRSRSWHLEDLQAHLKDIYFNKVNNQEWTQWLDCCLLPSSGNG
jgi:hypothetical protein